MATPQPNVLPPYGFIQPAQEVLPKIKNLNAMLTAMKKTGGSLRSGPADYSFEITHSACVRYGMEDQAIDSNPEIVQVDRMSEVEFGNGSRPTTATTAGAEFSSSRFRAVSCRKS